MALASEESLPLVLALAEETGSAGVSRGAAMVWGVSPGLSWAVFIISEQSWSAACQRTFPPARPPPPPSDWFEMVE